ncbi:acyl carrier protein [Ectobacillus antri]|uniref:acyl carrier protein n=1 Tax=Ectobacillus antri TaxID=2486280 RepID=UPI0013DDEDA1|nr:acyl carrier protein [Ectobacillus antri]
MFEKLKEIVVQNAKNKGDEIELTENTDLLKDLGYQSINVVQLMADLEEHFDFVFEDDEIDFDVICNFGKLSKFIQMKVETNVANNKNS